MNTVNYATNTAQRTPCVLILDASDSMYTDVKGGLRRIDLLNQGINQFYEALQEDDVALSRVQIAAVTVGGFSRDAEVLMDWTDATEFQPFELKCGYATPLGQGMLLALDAIKTQKENLREFGISYTRPWIICITDGQPTDEQAVWNEACREAKDAVKAGKVEIFPVGIEGADLSKLSELSERPPIKMDTMKFSELFVWLSASLGQLSRSVPGAEVDLPSVDPWASVKL
jgi:uncharacterized protein YegL